jgi:uncharacterized protein YwgA
MPKKMLDAEALVLAVLGALPAHEVRGRKRLQKMAFFAVKAGADSSVSFFLHDFGPFSSEVAGATDMLSYEGTITEEDAQFERSKRFYKRYRLPDPNLVQEKLPSESSGALKRLDEYSTVELEVASTILYFMGQGHSSERAIQETKDLKPSKSEPRIIERATEALLKVGLYERGRADPVSGPRPY